MIVNEKLSDAARMMGRRGGKAKVPKGFASLTPDQRRAVSKLAVAAREAKRKAAR